MIKKIIYIVFGMSIMCLFAGTAGYLYYKSQDPPVVFETESPIVGDIQSITVASGTIVPRKEIQIKPQVPGIVEEIYVQSGEKVQRGAALAKIRIVPDLVNLNEAENRLKKAGIAYADVKQELERQERLYKEQLISQVEFKRCQVKLKTVAADLQAAQNHIQLLKEGASKQGSVANNTLIQSTVDGTVLDIPVKEGDTVVEANAFNAGTTLAVIADMSALVFEGFIDESDVGKLHEGMKLYLSIGAIPEQECKATLEYIAPKGTKERDRAVQFQFKAAVEPEEGIRLRSGYSANAKIILSRKSSILTLSESLIMYDDKQRPYVEVEIDEQIFERKNLELGLSDGLSVEIVSGITVSDRVKKL
ncbi:MAG: efflux RND transporter periplasmic adaptor subunit [bacterium]|nr:efflux RND transporter periplasmic adaptor subunit [bacterium]